MALLTFLLEDPGYVFRECRGCVLGCQSWRRDRQDGSQSNQRTLQTGTVTSSHGRLLLVLRSVRPLGRFPMVILTQTGEDAPASSSRFIFPGSRRSVRSDSGDTDVAAGLVQLRQEHPVTVALPKPVEPQRREAAWK